MATLTRRTWLQGIACAAGWSASGWFPSFADEAVSTDRRRHCVLLWMSGGPSQLDTFDLKPGHQNGGPFREVDTSAPGVRFSEHLPKLAQQAQHLAIVRGLSTKEGDHGRGSFLMRTGRQPGGPIRYPTLGSVLSKELGRDDSELPNFVSIAPFRVFNLEAHLPGFLGPKYAPLTVAGVDNVQRALSQGAFSALGVDDLRAHPGVTLAQEDARRGLLSALQTEFVARHRTDATVAQDTVLQRAMRMMRSEAAQAFDLTQEPDAVREAYGKGRFGQGCLMARRLIERGVPFIEVASGGNGEGWDTHRGNFDAVKSLSAQLDAGWSSLMRELSDRGLLESTTILWMGEFGRTPKINPNNGRDHFPAAWSTVLAGGGIKGGTVYGKTSDDGMTVVEGKSDVGPLLATLATALGLDPKKPNISELGRPIRIADGEPIGEVLL